MKLVYFSNQMHLCNALQIQTHICSNVLHALMKHALIVSSDSRGVLVVWWWCEKRGWPRANGGCQQLVLRSTYE